MKYLIQTVCFLILSVSGIAQIEVTKDFDYDLGRSYKVVDAPVKEYFYQNGQVLSIKINKSNIIIQRFDADRLRELSHKEYPALPRSVAFEQMMKINGIIYIFYREEDAKAGIELLNYITVDFASGKIDTKEKNLLKTERKTGDLWGGSSIFASYSHIKRFNFRISEDSSKIMIQYRLKPTKRRNAINFDDIGFQVFDKNLNLIWKEMLPMPYTERNMNILDFYTDSKGVGYILARVADDINKGIYLKRSKKSEPNYHIELFRIEEGTGKFDITKIDLHDKFIHAIKLEEAGGRLLCGGFYNSGKIYGSADGIFYFNLDDKGFIEGVKTFEIPADIMAQYESRRTQRKIARKDGNGKAELEHLVMRNIVPFPDGSLLLTGEQYQMIVSTSTTANGGSSSTVTYHYDDIFAVKISPEGELVWMKKMAKKQQGNRGQGGMSYTLVSDQGNQSIYFLFLDNVKNMELIADRKPARHIDGQGGFFTGYKIDFETGKMTKTSIFDTRDVMGIKVYQYNTNRVIGLTSGEFLVEVYKKQKEDVLIKVYLKD